MAEKNMVRVISQQDVKKCIQMKEAIELQRKAFQALSPSTKSVIPERILLSVPNEGITLFKPAYFEENNNNSKDNVRVLGCKIVSVRAKNSNLELPTVPGSIILFDVQTGVTKGLMDAEYLTGLRTAAGSGVFTDIFANENATNLVIFGAGLQAEEHFKAVMEVRKSIKQVTIINRTEERAKTLIQKLEKINNVLAYSFCLLTNENAVKEALSNVDIICCCTNTSKPLFQSEWIDDNERHIHINAIGSYQSTMQEVPDGVIKKIINEGILVCDSKEAFNVGEFKNVSKEQLENVYVACDVLTTKKEEDINNNASNDKNKKKITMFKSVGTSIQDVVTSGAVFQNAEELNVGTLCPL